MTSADTLLPCPFCGGEARISRAHQNKMLAMGEVPTDEHYLFTLYHDCANGITICWTYKPKDALIAAWNRRTPPTPATEEREAVAQWCSGCHEVRSVDCYRAGCPKSDTERRAAEILAAEANERARDALQMLLNMAQPSICYLACEHGSTFEPSNPNIMHSDLCNELRAALTANHSAPVVEE